MYISDSKELAAFCERAASSRVLAVDTEFLREKTFYPKLCLIQVATEEESAAVDPILIRNLSSLRALFEDEKITKVFHACTQDLEVILEEMGCIPTPCSTRRSRPRFWDIASRLATAPSWRRAAA